MMMSSRISLLLDLSSGLQHMYRHRVLHRDIKSHNILLVSASNHHPPLIDGDDGLTTVSSTANHFTAMISDFGSSILLSSTVDCVKGDPVGTMGYTAPEVHSDDGYR